MKLMTMILGILLAVAVGLSGCKIVSATPDTETVIEVRPGETIEFKVSGPVNTPTSKCVWEVDKMDDEYDWPQYNTMLERSDTFKFTVGPDGGGTNRIRVRCVIYTLTIVGGPGSGCPFITPCVGWGPSASSRAWDIRILHDTAPVWQGNYHIWDSRDIELLKDYTTVTRSIFIDGDRIKNLEGIENLSAIGTSLRISNNDALTSLSGLEGLTSVGCILSINYNDALTSLAGLQNLTSVGCYFEIEHNAALTSLSGLENLTSVEDLKIWDNAALKNLSGLENITSVGDLIIWDNAALKNLSGLENITSVGDLFIGDNKALTALGMTGLRKVSGFFAIQDNSSLCRSLAEELRDHVLAGGGIGGEIFIGRNKECTTP